MSNSLADGKHLLNSFSCVPAFLIPYLESASTCGPAKEGG